jgi:hypothetical protein
MTMSNEQGCLCGRVGGGASYQFQVVGGPSDSADHFEYAHDAIEAQAMADAKREMIGADFMRLLGTRSSAASDFRPVVEDDELPNDLREEVLVRRESVRRANRRVMGGAR